MPMRTRAELDAATTIDGAFATRRRADAARAVMDALALGDIANAQGRAALDLCERSPAVAALEAGNRNQLLQDLERHRWIARTIRGKRCFAIALGPDLPDDWNWQPPVEPDTLAAGIARMVEPEPAPEPEHPEDLSAREEVGGRPGRFVARLERELPTLIANAVTVALAEQRRIELEALGYVPAAVIDTAHADELDALRERVKRLEAELRGERAAGHRSREELNAVIARAETVERSTVRPSEVPEDLRDLAQHAIRHGWTIRRTNGGHLAFKSPDGPQRFTSSTPSDWRTVRNFRADLEALGLPRTGR